ncbi:PDI-like 1-1 [Artemisia annua]|uniref:PDI-like 1-1 n=1 Tax=Artemisia annua TaxID=35608 RepID=A0A2U1MJL0_ARTAN|nr:PDI-like 1-1 [Artemisia annua]
MVRRLCCRSEELFAGIILLTSFINAAYLQIPGEYVLTLDHSNFTQAVSDHNFLVLQFYAPCENLTKLLCKFVEELEPEYEKAAWVLSTHESPIVMAKIDGSAQENKEISREIFKFEMISYPTIVILQNGGRDFHYYAGPRDADGLVTTLERLISPPSIEIKTASEALTLIDDEKISIVGIFPTFSGEEFENFTAIANQVLWDYWDYDFFHTSDASLIPRDESSSLTTKPALRLLKPFDELFVDSQNFHVRDMENFIIEASIPLEGKLKPFYKSQPIPETNDEPLKVVVGDSLQDMVLNSKKNVLLDIDYPSCSGIGFRKFAPFIPELAVLYENDDDIVIARLDITTNDIPREMFDIMDCHTLYLKAANGALLSYNGDQTKEDIIKFINKNRQSLNENSMPDIPLMTDTGSPHARFMS